MKSRAFFLSFALALSVQSSGVQAHEAGFQSPEASQEDAVISQFVSDLNAKRVSGLKDLAIRTSNHQRVEIRVSEQIHGISETRVVHCLACRKDAKPVDLKRIAKLSGIHHFLDLNYETSPEGQTLSMRITNANDGKEIWKKTYIHSQIITDVEVIEGAKFKLQATPLFSPKEHSGMIFGYGLGVQAKFRGWGLESNVYRNLESNTVVNLLAMKFWKVSERNHQFWLAAGANYSHSDEDHWNPLIRTGCDFQIDRRWTWGLFVGGRMGSRWTGVETGINLGFKLN